MANRARPRCPDCEKAMAPVFTAGARSGKVRVKDTFYCLADGRLAKGRRKVVFV